MLPLHALILFIAHPVTPSQEGAQKSIEPVKSRNLPPPLLAEGGSESSLTGGKSEGGGAKELRSSSTLAREHLDSRTIAAGSSQDITGRTAQHSNLDQSTN